MNHPRILPLLALIMQVFALHPAKAERYDGALRPGTTTPQDDINAELVSFTDLFHRGAHLYTNRFTTNDGYGEAPDGPRRSHLSLAGNAYSPFIRVNGLDAQSCLECHNVIGNRETNGLSLPREPGTVAGSAGIPATVMIFEDMSRMDVGIIRSPPHNFGLGYIQRLSDEMTADLLQIKDDAVDEARTSGDTVRVALTSKGVSFGHLTVLPNGGMDRSEVEGVSIDFVVRPFQFKGVASTLRNFVAGAMNFHFSVQPKELLDRAFILNDNPNGTLVGDKQDEILEGEVSAVAVFLAGMRPPMQEVTDLDAEAVARGRALMESVGCTACHVPSLRINDPHVTVVDPRYLRDLEFQKMGGKEYLSLRTKQISTVPSITAAEEFSEFLAPVVQYERGRGEYLPGFTFDLNDGARPEECLPRLPYHEDGSIDVPLFSDLRRHRMGQILSDSVEQKTEMQSIVVPRDQFTTRPLWGVADTGPWLHDGRATTLREAILFHEGPGSEANDSLALFKALEPGDQEAVVEFLRSLRVRPKQQQMRADDPSRNGLILR